jgi:hypothetical protein
VPKGTPLIFRAEISLEIVSVKSVLKTHLVEQDAGVVNRVVRGIGG